MNNILLLGQSGQVGRELRATLAPLGKLIVPDRTQFDLTNADSMGTAILQSKPDVIVNAAGFTIVDAAEKQPDLAMQVNGIAPGVIGEAAKHVGALVIHYSTTFVFDGTKREPYTEHDTPNPLNAYGRSKLAGEQAVRGSGADHIILRANWTYSSRRTNFVLAMLNLIRSQARVTVVDDQVGTPTWARAYARATAELLNDPRKLREGCGTYNLSADGCCTRYQWAERILELAKARAGMHDGWAHLTPTTNEAYANTAPRPLYTVTDNRRIRDTFGIAIGPWGTGLSECFGDMEWG